MDIAPGGVCIYGVSSAVPSGVNFVAVNRSLEMLRKRARDLPPGRLGVDIAGILPGE